MEDAFMTFSSIEGAGDMEESFCCSYEDARGMEDSFCYIEEARDTTN